MNIFLYILHLVQYHMDNIQQIADALQKLQLIITKEYFRMVQWSKSVVTKILPK